MDLLKKFFCIIILFSLLAAFFPLSSRAASSDIDIGFTKNAQTVFDIEAYQRRQQDVYLNRIKSLNNSLAQQIINKFNNGSFFYIHHTYDPNKDTNFYDIYFYQMTDTAYTMGSLSYDNLYIYNNNNVVGSYYLRPIPIEKQYIQFTFSNNSNSFEWSNYYTDTYNIPISCVGYLSDYFIKFYLDIGGSSGSSSNDYSNILNTISSDLSTLLYNSNTIMGDIANVKNYANYINNKLTTTNTYLSNIQGAINNGSSTITNTIVSTHNLDNSNDNKNTNEIIDAINDNTNAISDIQVTNDNSDLINAINNGFSNLNSNNNTNKNQIVSAINNASEEITDGQDYNTNTIINNSNSNTNDIVEAIEGITITGGSGGITNTEYSQGISAINDNNDYNTNRILDNQVTEEDADIFSNIDTPEFDDPLPNLTTTLNNFFDNITSSNITSKTFNLSFRNMHLDFTLDYNTLYNKFFSKNTTFYNLYKALWWAVIGFYVYKKLRVFYNQCIAGEWDEVVTAFDDSDEIIGRSVK